MSGFRMNKRGGGYGESRSFNKERGCLKILVALLLFCLCDKSAHSQEYSAVRQKTYYIAPNGIDAHPGSKSKPWRSMAKVARTLKAGDTAIFEDGDYFERGIANFAHDGTKERPIVIKAKNKHKARIIFSEKLKSTAKVRIIGRKFIELLDFEITQVARSQDRDKNKTSDIMIVCSGGSEEILIAGNYIHYCFEDGIKIGSSKNILIKNNTLSDMEHEGIDAVNIENLVIQGNTINEVGRVGVLVKGGSRNATVFDNLIKNERKEMKGHGIAIGGETKLNAAVSALTYEAYGVYAWNNVVVAKNKGKIKWGISFIGAKDSEAHNNVIVGAEYGIAVYSPNGLKNGWGWKPIVTNVNIKNNIMYNIKRDAFYYNHKPINMESDYNLYYEIGGLIPSNEKNSLNKDPLFMDPYSNWTLKPGSPGLGNAGTVVNPQVALMSPGIKGAIRQKKNLTTKNRGLNK